MADAVMKTTTRRSWDGGLERRVDIGGRRGRLLRFLLLDPDGCCGSDDVAVDVVVVAELLLV